ncbi:TraR/DksA family transcriptional regulator [Streptomyces indicus]|uniref:Uncharacterized protein n=1 Tax=Streptomyces indicus TaxID=417292 RepID=A0A1G9DES9_9ACTN|nr:hypothetical protein [Streptomyces indicus]SDK62362.1 hypothetical protein SAMN05421806_109186 [Streptomyces indicus]
MVNHRTTGPSSAPLAADDLARLRADLQEQRLFRREQLRQLAGPSGTRAEERRQRAAAQIEVQVKLATSARMVLADVEAALARMDAGTYGVCHRCRCPIGRDRLTIVPQARYCGGCRRAGRAAP